MEDEELCEQCGREPASGAVQRVWGSLQLCEGCREAEQRTPEAPIAATWDVDADELLIAQVWPVSVNLHSFHLERVLQRGIEVPPRLEGDDPKP